MHIEFDPDKDAANHEKHGISLAFGADILADAKRVDVLDVRFDYAEERFVAYRAGRGNLDRAISGFPA